MECLPEGGWFSRGRSPRENHPPEGIHSTRIPTLAWHICFIIPNKPQFGKISMKTTMTATRSSENGGRFAGGHFACGHDGMANLCKAITAYDFHVRYNNVNWPMLHLTQYLPLSGYTTKRLNPFNIRGARTWILHTKSKTMHALV